MKKIILIYKWQRDSHPAMQTQTEGSLWVNSYFLLFISHFSFKKKRKKKTQTNNPNKTKPQTKNPPPTSPEKGREEFHAFCKSA